MTIEVIATSFPSYLLLKATIPNIVESILIAKAPKTVS